MDSATISALAALSGAVIGGVTSFGTSWLSQQTQAKVQARAHKLSQREDLYKHFIEIASKAYADSLVRQAANVAEITQLVDLYALVSMMRVISSTPIVESANHVDRLIADSYVSPNKTIRELHQMMDSDSIDSAAIQNLNQSEPAQFVPTCVAKARNASNISDAPPIRREAIHFF